MILATMLLALLPQLSFEVASIKPSAPMGPSGGACHGSGIRSSIPLGRCVFVRTSLYHLITYAYGLERGPLPRNQMSIRGPDWLRPQLFDLEAKADNPLTVSQDDLILMLQALLAERFKLKFHNETREFSGFALVAGKAKVRIADPNAPRIITIVPAKRDAPLKDLPAQKSIKARNSSMFQLVNALSNFAGGPVVDKTGLSGNYEFDLTWDAVAGPSLFTAVQEQLGLRLEPQKMPVTLLVVDSAVKPTTN